MKQPNSILVALFLLLTTLCNADDRTPIGVSVSLTGPGATWGNDVRDALEFAADFFGDNRYRLIFEDDKCSAKEAASIAQKFVTQDKVRYVLGYNCSSSLLGATPMYSGKNIIVLASGATANSKYDGAFVFRTWPHDQLAATQLGKWASKRFKSVGILSEQADYAEQFQSAFSAAIASREIKISADSFLPSQTDFRSQIMRLKSQGIDAFFVNPVNESAFVDIVRQYKELGGQAVILGAFFPGSSTFIRLAGNSSDGIVYVDVPDASNILRDEGKKVMQAYRRKYGEPRTWEFIVGSAIEAFRTLMQAEASLRTPSEFLKTTSFSGVYGPYRFDREGYTVGINHAIFKYQSNRKVNISEE